jgi:hypothetical protein
MKKLVPLAVAAAFVATAAFASIRHPSVVVSSQHAVVDTVIPQDTTQPNQNQNQNTTVPSDTNSTTDTSGYSH